MINTTVGQVFKAPSTAGGNCYAIAIHNGGGSLDCPSLHPRDLNLAFFANSGNETEAIFTGAAITRVILTYRDGKTQTVNPIDGVALAKIPADEISTIPSMPGRRLPSIATATGLNPAGHIVVIKQIQTN